MNNVYVIIGAAGSGKRMGAPMPKQFLNIGGKTILEKTVDKFAALDIVSHMVVVTHADYRNRGYALALLTKATEIMP